MPNFASFGSAMTSSSNIGSMGNSMWAIIGAFVALVAVIMILYMVWPSRGCPRQLEKQADGSLKAPDGRTFPDMNAFQQWFSTSGCPLPILTGAVPVVQDNDMHEETYAKTPIYKVDDYELSRVFGNERNGHMVIPRQNFNMILEQRTFDWADKPMSSDERRAKYRGLQEGFTAAGELKSETMRTNELKSEMMTADPAREAAARFGENRGSDDIDCKLSREAKEVAGLVAKAYENDPNWEPVVTRVGANHWEVNELKPRRRDDAGPVVEERIVNTADDRVDLEFRYKEKQITDAAIDPYFPVNGSNMPFESERLSKDPFYGPVPGLERMFGPTFDQSHWY
jgi:hypothetical protein